MHEYSIASAIFEQVESQRRAWTDAKVTAIHLRIGELAGVDRGLLQSAWSLLCEGTSCAEADLRIAGEPACWTCERCGTALEPGARLRCEPCGAPARLSTGDALILERIEMEVDDV